MTCPKCGLQTQADQKFCRSCGTSLRMTTQPLAELAIMSDQERTPTIGVEREAQLRNGFVLWGFIIMFVGVAIGVVGKKLLHVDIVTVVGVLLSLLGMFLSVYPFLAPPRRKKVDSSPSSQSEVLTPSRPTEYLPQGSNTEYIPSITERTTDLLKNSAASRPGRQENGESGSGKSERSEKPLD
jgi:zinc ribbon protein